MAVKLVPVTWRDEKEHRRELARAVNNLSDGRSNGFGEIILDANQATTTLTDARIGADSVITFMPTTANAAAEVGAGGMYVGTVVNGSATITHANNANADRTFGYAIQG